MNALEPRQIWWTAEDIVAAGLPEMPGSKRGINLLAARLSWREIPGCAQRKRGRGGGWQYHWSVLPQSAQHKLLKDASETPAETHDRGTAWANYDGLTEAAKQKAANRLKAIQTAEALYTAGSTHLNAMATAARAHNVSTRTLYNWQDMIEGVAPEDRLAYLVPRNRLAKRKPTKTACTQAFIDLLKSLYLRLEQPTFKQCYRMACAQAKSNRWNVLTERTAMRRINAEVPHVTQVFAREGQKGLQRCFPAQIRDRSGLSAMEGVNADCHKIDIFVQWPDGTINRPQIIAFQDLFSGKILSWRVDHDPNKVMVMAAFGEMIENWGIPHRCLFDNGREFANKWLTGGTKTRFRFKICEDDPLGVLPQLGIQVHWATPAHGQAKPVERAFGDFARNIAKDPRFSGAYVGNRPDAKPENYGQRAIPAETFISVLAEGIAEHNARQGRISHTTQGRSFDDTFAESYADAPIRKATEEQRRLWLMGQQVGKLNRDTGQLRLYNNYYHSEWMSQHPNLKIIARFDPEDLHAGVYIYARDGAFLGFAECRQKVGFFDLTAAKETARRNARIKRAQKALVQAHKPVSIEQIGRDMNASAPAAEKDFTSKVVSPEFGRKPAPVVFEKPQYQPLQDAEVEAAQNAMILNMKPTENATSETDDPAARFWRAREILARAEIGKAIGRDEARWVQGYRETAEYEGLLVMLETHGKDGVG
jgi:putative transposase